MFVNIFQQITMVLILGLQIILTDLDLIILKKMSYRNMGEQLKTSYFKQMINKSFK